MVTIAMTSDNHFDVNKVDVPTAVEQQAAYLRHHHIDYYLIAGDLFNHFDQSMRYLEDLQAQLPHTRVLFIAGNHDMMHDVSYEALESPINDCYLHNKAVDLPGTDWRILGNNGWYDYRFADNLPNRDFAQWKRAFWADASIEQPMSDPERMTIVLKQVKQQIADLRRDHKRGLFMTHFVPKRDYIRYTADDRFWNMANAMMGSPDLGELIDESPIEQVLFGHMHIHPTPRDIDGTVYFNQSVGYGIRRLSEWQQPTFIEQWQSRLKIEKLE